MVTLASANVEIRARFTKFDNDLRVGTAKALEKLEKDFDKSFDRAGKKGAKTLQKEIGGAKLKPDVDLGPFERKFKEGVKRSTQSAQNDTEKAFKKIENGLKGISKTAFGVFKFAGIAGGIASIVAELSALIGVAIEASKALLLVPAALAGALTVFAVFKIGVIGIGKALKALVKGDIGEFNAALKNLAPSARAFVLEIKKIKPALDEFRKAIQNALFAGFADQVKVLAKTLLPVMRTGLVGVAGALNTAARSVLTFLASSGELKSFGQTFTNIKLIILGLTPALAPLTKALTDLVNVGMAVLAEKTKTAADALKNFSANISAAAANGSLKKTIEDAVAALGKLFNISRNVFNILKNIFNAAFGANNLVDDLEKVTKKLDDITKSAEGQKNLKDIFKGLEVGGPLLLGLSALSGIFGIIAGALKPVTVGIGLLAGALSAAEIPLLPFIAGIGAAAVALGLIAAGFILAYNNVKPFKDAVDGLVDVLGKRFGDTINIVKNFIVNDLVPAFKSIAEAARPIVDFIGTTFKEKILPVIDSVAKAFNDNLKPVLDTIAAVIRDTVKPAIDKLGATIENNKEILGTIIGVITTVLGFLAKVAFFLIGTVLKVLVTIVGFLVGAAIDGITRAIQFISFVGNVISVVIAFFIQFGVIVVNAFKAVVGFFSSLGDTIATAFTAIVAFFVGLGQKIVDAFNAIVNFFQQVPGKILAVLVTAGSFLFGFGKTIIDGFLKGITGAFNAVVNFFKAIPGKIKAIFSTAGNFLFDIGKKIINGLVDGLKAGADLVKKAVQFLINLIPDGLKKILHISSPSRVMRTIGEQIVDGLVLGMDNRLNAVTLKAGEIAKVARTGIESKISTNLGTIPALNQPANNPAGQAGPVRPATVVGASVIQNIVVNLPTGDPLAAALAVSNRIAASVA